MSSIDGLIAHARARPRKTTPGLPPEPSLRTVILTCMDARIDPVSLFGLGPGDAHVLRNAGARATPDVMRSLALSQAILGTREVLVLGHTGCGLFERTEGELSETIRSKSGHRPNTALGAFNNLDAAVDETVNTLRRCPFLAHRDRIRGYVYDLDAGSVRPAGGEENRTAGPTRARPMTGLEMLRADVLDLKTQRHRRAP
ncbi:MAG TPA: carbonic anhydrase [Candidatus Dormibacteraeota bacterium]